MTAVSGRCGTSLSISHAVSSCSSRERAGPGLLGGGGSPERTGLVPSMRLLPLVGRPENSRDFVRRGWTK